MATLELYETLIHARDHIRRAKPVLAKYHPGSIPTEDDADRLIAELGKQIEAVRAELNRECVR